AVDLKSIATHPPFRPRPPNADFRWSSSPASSELDLDPLALVRARCVSAGVVQSRHDAEPRQEIDSHVVPSVVMRQVLRRHAGDGLTGITALRQQAPRGIELSRTLEFNGRPVRKCFAPNQPFHSRKSASPLLPPASSGEAATSGNARPIATTWGKQSRRPLNPQSGQSADMLACAANACASSLSGIQEPRRRAGSSGGKRPGANGARSTWRAAPSMISSLIASPVAGALSMPQTL